MRTKMVGFRVPTALYEKLVGLAQSEGTTISDVARSIVEKHVQVSAVLTALDGLDIARRFRELYAQARIANHGLDALARAMLGDKYDDWLTDVKRGLKRETESKKKNEEATTR